MRSALTAGLQCPSCEGDSLESVSKQSGMPALLPPLPFATTWSTFEPLRTAGARHAAACAAHLKEKSISHQSSEQLACPCPFRLLLQVTAAAMAGDQQPSKLGPGSKIAVFCGASAGNSPEYVAAAKALGEEMARRGIGLVYGGGNVG